MQKRLSLFPAACLIVLAGCDLEQAISSERYTQDFHYSYPLKAGGKLTVENFNGSVHITGWDQETVDVSGTKYASTPELRDALKIDVVPSADSIYIRTVRPSDARGGIGARYVIKVPRRTQLERINSSNGTIRTTGVEGNANLKTSNGSVEVEDLAGDANVKTSNGRIQADAVGGSIEATTTNGSIHAHLLKPEAGRPVKLETSNGAIVLTLKSEPGSAVQAATTNGAITIYLPASASARVKADTTNGAVTSDFAVKEETARSKQHLDGTIGSGGPMMELNTTNGSIRILKQM